MSIAGAEGKLAGVTLSSEEDTASPSPKATAGEDKEPSVGEEDKASPSPKATAGDGKTTPEGEEDKASPSPKATAGEDKEPSVGEEDKALPSPKATAGEDKEPSVGEQGKASPSPEAKAGEDKTTPEGEEDKASPSPKATAGEDKTTPEGEEDKASPSPKAKAGEDKTTPEGEEDKASPSPKATAGEDKEPSVGEEDKASPSPVPTKDNAGVNSGGLGATSKPRARSPAVPTAVASAMPSPMTIEHQGGQALKASASPRALVSASPQPPPGGRATGPGDADDGLTGPKQGTTADDDDQVAAGPSASPGPRRPGDTSLRHELSQATESDPSTPWSMTAFLVVGAFAIGAWYGGLCSRAGISRAIGSIVECCAQIQREQGRSVARTLQLAQAQRAAVHGLPRAEDPVAATALSDPVAVAVQVRQVTGGGSTGASGHVPAPGTTRLKLGASAPAAPAPPAPSLAAAPPSGSAEPADGFADADIEWEDDDW